MKNMAKKENLRKQRGVKKFAELVNKMITGKDPNKPEISFGDYNKEVSRITLALHEKNPLSDYNVKDFGKLSNIIDKFGLGEINFERVSNIMEKIPECRAISFNKGDIQRETSRGFEQGPDLSTK